MTFREKLILHALAKETNGKEGWFLFEGDSNGESLENAIFIAKNFDDIHLAEPGFTNCIFRETDFAAGYFSGGEFSGCEFINCSFHKAQFYRPVFENVIFYKCKFSSTHFSDALFRNCIFVGPDFNRVYLGDFMMKDCVLTDVVPVEIKFIGKAERENVIWIPKIEGPDASHAQPQDEFE